MKRKATKFTTKAKALTDPQPKFVSLVKAGANMTPFLAVKTAGTSQEDDMLKVKRSDDHDIAGFKFSKEKFDSVDKVKAWLDAGGYSDYSIKEEDYGYSIAGRTDLTDVREVTLEGVTTLVGKLPAETPVEKTSAEEAEAAGAVVATKEEETTKEKPDVQETTEKSAEGPVEGQSQPEVPAGEAAKDEEEAEKEEVGVQPVAKFDVAAAQQVLRQKGIYDICNIGEMLYTLRWMVEDAVYTNLPDEQVAQLKSAAASLLNTMAYFMQESLDSFVEIFKSAEPRAAEAEKNQKTEETQPSQEAPKAEPETPVGETEAAKDEKSEAESPADQEPKDELTALKEQVAALKAQIEKFTNPEADSAAKGDGEDGVKSLETKRQTRKGADVSDLKPAAENTAKKDAEREFQRQTLRSMIGSLK